MTRKAKAAKRPAKPKPVAVYTVVRKIPAEVPAHSIPERVFATKKAAQAFADERNRELRMLVNPFEHDSPDALVKGKEKAFTALVKQLGLTAPTKQKGYSYIDWEAWWDRTYFDLTDAQRDALWDALDAFDWYKVKATTLED